MPMLYMGRDIPNLTKLQALQMAYNMPNQSAFDWEVAGTGQTEFESRSCMSHVPVGRK